MGKLFNFENIGKKIKFLTKWSCWISIVCVWVIAFFMVLAVLLSGASIEGIIAGCFLAILLAVIGPILIWISCWTLYAFGEITEDTHAMRKKVCQSEDAAEAKATREAALKARRYACPKCKKTIHYGEDTCKFCGQTFHWDSIQKQLEKE